jgi:hypothetical protein
MSIHRLCTDKIFNFTSNANKVALNKELSSDEDRIVTNGDDEFDFVENDKTKDNHRNNNDYDDDDDDESNDNGRQDPLIDTDGNETLLNHFTNMPMKKHKTKKSKKHYQFGVQITPAIRSKKRYPTQIQQQPGVLTVSATNNNASVMNGTTISTIEEVVAKPIPLNSHYRDSYNRVFGSRYDDDYSKSSSISSDVFSSIDENEEEEEEEEEEEDDEDEDDDYLTSHKRKYQNENEHSSSSYSPSSSYSSNEENDEERRPNKRQKVNHANNKQSMEPIRKEQKRRQQNDLLIRERSRRSRSHNHHSRDEDDRNINGRRECFLCAWGDKFHDGIKAPHINKLNMILDDCYGRYNNDELAQQIHLYYKAYVYNKKSGMCMLRSSDVLEHIEGLHTLNAKFFIGESIKTWKKILFPLVNTIFRSDGTFDYKTFTCAEKTQKLIISMYKSKMDHFLFNGGTSSEDLNKIGTYHNLNTMFTQDERKLIIKEITKGKIRLGSNTFPL